MTQKTSPDQVSETPFGQQLGLQLAAEALEHKALEPVLLDARGLNAYADFFLIVSGASERQVSAVSDSLIILAKKTGNMPIGVEGRESSRWILVDFGSLVVHVLHKESRFYYDLDSLWSDATRVEIPGVPSRPSF